MEGVSNVVDARWRFRRRATRVDMPEDVGHVMSEPSPRRLPEPFFYFDEWGSRKRETRCLGVTDDMEEAKQLAAKNRHLDCANYERCLDRAARCAWRGFDCRGCGAYQRDEMFLADERAQAMRSGE